MTVRTSRLFAAAALVGLLVGCSRNQDINIKVTYKGKPVVAGRVMVFGSDGLPRRTRLDADGTGVIEQLPPGTARVCVTTQRPKVLPKGWVNVPDKYSRPTATPLRLEVTRDVKDYELTLE